MCVCVFGGILIVVVCLCVFVLFGCFFKFCFVCN